MNVRFAGRHVSIPEVDREYLVAKVEALGRYHRHIQDVEVRVAMDGSLLERVELEADLGRHKVVAHSDAREFRAAGDQALETLKHLLLRDKEKTAARRRRPARAPARGGRS